MMEKRLTKALLIGGVFSAVFMAPAIALAQQTTAPAAAAAWQLGAIKALAAGLAMGLSALAAGYAQGKIGSAGAGTLAERPEAAIWVITLQALPEIIVLLGFVSAILINAAS